VNTTELYEHLGVDIKASKEEIKKAYRAKAKKHHPDKGGDEYKFKAIQKAYDVLGNDLNRSKYDNGEPIKAPDVKTQAKLELAALFTQIIAKKDFDTKDPLELMRGSVREHTASLNVQCNNALFTRKRLLKAKRKLIAHTDHNILGEVIRAQRVTAYRSYKAAKQGLKVMKEILVLINEYEYKPDPTERQPTTMIHYRSYSSSMTV
jgi:curved DNA-binding protein CbpA